MQRLRLKADGRIVELRDGQEIPLATAHPAEAAMLPAPTAIATFRVPKPSAVMKASDNSSAGNAISTSTKRPTALSSRPPA